ncbi:MAG: mechanosensitive ion channel family protein [Deltaproteobacteria bacterium]|nr:mechanosensitive ion channel family protein [Deltaproteobacteria bacterium]
MKPQLAESVHWLLEVLIPLGIFLVVVALGVFSRRVVQTRLARWAGRTQSRLGEAILAAIRTPFWVLCVMLGIYLALEFSSLPKSLVAKAETLLSILAVFAVSMVTANILSGFTRMRAESIDTLLPVTSLTENIIRIIVYGVGILIILNHLGISIAPILATLGVGGLAVALALKDTLSNFFAGFHIVATRQIRVGDYLKLDSGEEGHVHDISWRTTKIQTLAGNFVLIPNAKLTELIVTNFSLPAADVQVTVELGVHYSSDLTQVERVLCETATEVMKETKGAVPDFQPLVRYQAFGDSSIDLSVILRAETFKDQFLVKHEFIKRVHNRFAAEGIVIPYPIRALNRSQEKGR